MDKKGITSLVCTLVIFMLVVSPTAAATPKQNNTLSSASSSSTENMIIPIYEDESVVANLPDSNFDANTNGGGLFVGYEPTDGDSRSWLKYDLSSIPKEIGITSVSVNLYCNQEFMSTEDLPLAIYYSDDDTWSETTITWNNQPSFDASPLDVIDTPASPNMFVPGTWYSWDVTSAFKTSLTQNKTLSLVLKQIDEVATNVTWIYFVEKEYDAFTSSYLSLEYTTPNAINLKVDGQDTAPLIDYIQDSTPDLSWTMGDSGSGEYQSDYALEVNSNQYFNGINRLSTNHTQTVTVHDSSVNQNVRPFGTATEFRYQMKYVPSLLTTSGIVDQLRFETIEETGMITLENLVVLLVSTPDTTDLTSDFQANYGTAKPVIVLNRTSYSAKVENYHFMIDVENTFFLNARESFIFELRFTNNTGTLLSIPITNNIGGSTAYTYGTGAYTAITAGVTDTRANSLDIVYTSDEAFTTPGTMGNHFPFDTDDGHSGIMQFKYNTSLINDTGIIDRIFFTVNSYTNEPVFEGFKVYLAETPLLGPLSPTDFASNYQGTTPRLVLDKDVYTLRNLGGVLVIDVDNTFRYTGTHDLLVELRWDNKVSGSCSTYMTMDSGAYRAYNVTWVVHSNGDDTACYDTTIDFIHPETSIVYSGLPLVNATTYYWRVKTCDSTGIWSDWTSMHFKYEKLDSVPEFTAPVTSPTPAYAGQSVTLSLNVTYFLGINQVLIEMDGTNNTMTADGDTYSYTWTPSSAGDINYTIYMESTIHTWSSVSDTAKINAQLLGGTNLTLLLIIAGAGVVIVVIVILILKGRGKK